MKTLKQKPRTTAEYKRDVEAWTKASSEDTFRVDTLTRLPNGNVVRETAWLTKSQIRDQLQHVLVPLASNEVKSLRRSLGLSQTLFARWLHVSPQAVQKWEQKTGVASGPILRLLHIIRDDLAHWTKQIRQQVRA